MKTPESAGLPRFSFWICALVAAWIVLLQAAQRKIDAGAAPDEALPAGGDATPLPIGTPDTFHWQPPPGSPESPAGKTVRAVLRPAAPPRQNAASPRNVQTPAASLPADLLAHLKAEIGETNLVRNGIMPSSAPASPPGAAPVAAIAPEALREMRLNGVLELMRENQQGFLHAPAQRTDPADLTREQADEIRRQGYLITH